VLNALAFFHFFLKLNVLLLLTSAKFYLSSLFSVATSHLISPTDDTHNYRIEPEARAASEYDQTRSRPKDGIGRDSVNAKSVSTSPYRAIIFRASTRPVNLSLKEA
jgi:hypothetical protein